MTKATESNNHPTAESSDTDRKRSIRQWIDGKLGRWAGRGAAGGLLSTVMALPALSQASIEELYAFQFAETIPGVRSAKLMKNGDVLLKLADGRTMIVTAENVQVLDSGAIMIAEDVVAEIVQFSAAEAGATATGGIGGTGAALGGLGLAGAAAAAGGGGGDDDVENSGDVGGVDNTPQPEPTYTSLNLAELQTAALNNVSTDSAAPEGTSTVEVTVGSLVNSMTPNADGSWSLSLTAAEAAALPQGVTAVSVRHLDDAGTELSVQTVRFDIDTIPPTLAITGLSDGAVLNSAEQATDLTVFGSTDAEDGQVVTVSLNGQTYSATVSGGQWSVTVPASALTALPDGATVSLTADVTDAAGNPASQASGSFDTDFTAPTITLDPVASGSIELADVAGDLMLTGLTTAADGQPVNVTFNGQPYTGVASGGSWNATIPNADLGGLVTGTPATITVVVEDAAGNQAVPVAVSVPVDLTGPSVFISPLSVGAVLNTAEAGADLTVSGTTGNVEDGQQVTVTLDGQTYTGTVTSGAWSVTIPTANLVALADGSSFSVTADISDANGLPAPQADVSLGTDLTAPTLSIDSFSDGAVMNAAEQATDLIISGATTAEDGQTVSVDMSGKSYSGTVSAGAWSVAVTASDLTALSDAVTVIVTADVSDAAGNPAAQASSSFDTDFTPPSLDITNVSDGVIMNAAEQGTDLTVSGASDAPDGTIVNINISRSDGTTDVSGTATVTGGTWTYTATGAELSALQDAETYSINASISDTAGNNNLATVNFATDFTVPVITIDALPVGPVLDVTEQGADLTVSGTTSAEDGRTVSVTFGGQTYAGTVSSGAWSISIPSSDLSALSDGSTYTVSATVDDLAGNNSATASSSISTDFRPILTMDDIGVNDAVALNDAQMSGLTITGSSVGLSNGQTIDITLNGNAVGSATVAADGSWSSAIASTEFSAINAGDNLLFSAQATVSGGPNPLAVNDQVTAHEPAAYVITEAGRTGSTITFEIYADADRDISSGLAITAELEFDSSVVTFDNGSAVEHNAFDLFLASPGTGDIINFAGAATVFSDVSQPLVTFTMTVQDPNQPIVLTIKTPDGGPSILQIGTNGDDSLTASRIDTFVQGGIGDDTIDVSASGRDVVVFEADSVNNGSDTVTGFTIGPAAEMSDALMFSGLDASTLRGDGTGFELLSAGDSIGANTGFVGLDSVLIDLNLNTIENAVESFSGAVVGDEIYVMATDGTDSVLVKADFVASDNASVQTVASFQGLNDLSNLHTDNVLHTDPTGASA
ncbi:MULTISPECIES: Ig-like domain-containing protein [unclassified Ruegeria]|uniref:Ig-like domain-containing protein n=1 Tax=unclassified Ruegeria TaxID=2625375 RepID=UPI001492E8AF|nr:MULTISPECIES: Ig-like domain-containing protein [unclassified Ruegeria]NOD47551.1 adhesin [Ruegeria sp. HKCCD5849]NOD52786.1 adhesin [Ruegeria sp. HKCCD5851]NOD66205.1 adhesin [Ruegeria sp. HKCCD7303]